MDFIAHFSNKLVQPVKRVATVQLIQVLLYHVQVVIIVSLSKMNVQYALQVFIVIVYKDVLILQYVLMVFIVKLEQVFV